MRSTFHKGENASTLFPVIQSLLSPQALITEVLSNYDIGNLVECKLLSHNLNDTYLVSTNNYQYILRVSQAPRPAGRTWRSVSDILYELDLLLHLKRKGASVAVPLARRDGTLFGTVNAPEGQRVVVLFTYASGEPLAPPKQTPLLSALYGRTVAEIHEITDDFVSAHSRFHLDLAFLLDTPLQTIQPLLTHRANDWNDLLQLANLLKERIARLPIQRLDQGTCHGDAQGGNAVLSVGKMLTFFDFDVSGSGWRAYDLAVFYWGMTLGKSRLGWDNEQVERLWTAYLEGYLERRNLSGPDLQAIPLFVMLRHFWFLGLHTANWDYWGWEEINDRFFDRELVFLREWATQWLE
ncbi:phosphotransferase [Ktedonospora formicarum]|uniref:Aminoglycoside phosphotransferase domain-containing protein n=1 Tax=Ktedonospora formicarum TaxID=2778364 RepID=A0A8J3I6K5_9CHLR|nr:phosphotransferase [Ktedonospora formicarum]GHO48346.1 hypothetical protein KSX_65090 [Ktedonospora formicarum]